MRKPSATDIMAGYWLTGNNEEEARLKLHFAESLVFAFSGDEIASDGAAESVIASSIKSFPP